MRPISTMSGASLPLTVYTMLAMVGKVVSHSWGEEQFRIASNGTFVGAPGWSRAYIPRADPSFADSRAMWQLPKNADQGPATNKIMGPQRSDLTDASYSEQFPMLKVAPEDWVAFLYTENGHVSRQDLEGAVIKPINRGTVYVYGTTQNDLSDYDLEDIHLTWTRDGKGGDGKGQLIATRHFDDGQCYEAIPASGDTEGISSYRIAKFNAPQGGLKCQTDFQIPSDVPVGETYTAIWVWDWNSPKKRGVAVSPASFDDPEIGHKEYYISVADYEIVDPCSDELGSVKGATCKKPNATNVVKFAKQPDVTRSGIEAQMKNHFLVKVPQAGFKVKAAIVADKNTIPLACLIGIDRPVTAKIPANDMINFPALPGTGSESDEPPSPSVSTLPDAGTTPRPSPPADDNGGILTVTVTVPQTTVFVTATRTATVESIASPSSAPESSQSKRSNLRGSREKWSFGA